MKVMIIGAGPLGCLYAHLFSEAKVDVTLLARGRRYELLKNNGLELMDEHTGSKYHSHIQLASELKPDDEYELVIVIVRKNRLQPLFETLAACTKVKNILFMGNNALGFEEYLHHLPAEKILFGFPSAGGGFKNDVVHYVDREKAGAARKAVTIGELDGKTRERTLAIKATFEKSGIPVSLVEDIDGWLKYHLALILPLVCALYKHDSDNYALAKDDETIRLIIRATNECGQMLAALGHTKRQPYVKFTLLYWLPEFLNAFALRKLLNSTFAEIGFSLHARSARDEMGELATELQSLKEKTTVEMPNFDTLVSYLG